MTDDGKPILHVVFGMSAAASLRQALYQVDRHERVIGLSDDLSCGPINTVTAELRRHWFQEGMGYEDEDDEYGRSADVFWTEATRPDVFPVAWVSRRCAIEYANFLEFVWRLKGAPCRVVDLTDVMFLCRNGQRKPAQAFGVVTPNQMIEAGLLDRQSALSNLDRDAYELTWRRLKEEDAALRIVAATGLVSVPITYFDEMLRSCVTDQWLKCARVVGEALGRQMNEPYCQTGDLLLWARLRAIAEAGLVESRGDMSLIRESYVRNIQSR
jgi:Protein of unknown function/Domain of unknown function (DUF1835)